jgi:hypothetical protein
MQTNPNLQPRACIIWWACTYAWSVKDGPKEDGHVHVCDVQVVWERCRTKEILSRLVPSAGNKAFTLAAGVTGGITARIAETRWVDMQNQMEPDERNTRVSAK